MKNIVPDIMVTDRGIWTVERVWPAGREGTEVSFEAQCEGEIRGGYIGKERTPELVDPRDDTELPALKKLCDEGAVVSHRPGKRAVVRLAFGGYAKAVRPGRASCIVRRHENARGLARGGIRLPQLSAPDAATVCLSTVPGRTFAELGGDAAVVPSQWQEAWATWRKGWTRALLRAGAQKLPPHHVEEEIAILRSAMRNAEILARHPLPSDMTATATKIEDRVAMLAAAPTMLSHRDLHPKQLLWDADRGAVGLIDLDTAACADPGLDLGNLLAHVEFAALAGEWTVDRAVVAVAEIMDAAAELRVGDARLFAWRDAARLRVGLVHIMRPRGAEAARKMLELCREEERDVTYA